MDRRSFLKTTAAVAAVVSAPIALLPEKAEATPSVTEEPYHRCINKCCINKYRRIPILQIKENWEDYVLLHHKHPVIVGQINKGDFSLIHPNGPTIAYCPYPEGHDDFIFRKSFWVKQEFSGERRFSARRCLGWLKPSLAHEYYIPFCGLVQVTQRGWGSTLHKRFQKGSLKLTAHPESFQTNIFSSLWRQKD